MEIEDLRVSKCDLVEKVERSNMACRKRFVFCHSSLIS